jgi:hypothetical protein
MRTSERRRDSGRGAFARSGGGLLPVALLALAAGCAGSSHSGFEELPLPPGGTTVRVDSPKAVVFPLTGIEEMEIEYRASGHLHLTYATADGPEAAGGWQIPWRYLPLRAGTGTLRLDFRTTQGWLPTRAPFLRIAGTGEFVVTRVRARHSGRNQQESMESLDRAWRWAPVSVGHYSINLLDLSYWEATRGTLLFERLGWVFLALVAGGSAAVALFRRRWWPGPAVALAAVVTMGLGNVVFLARLVPALDLHPPPGVEERIRDNYRFDAEIGPLAALARATLLPGDRVAVMAPPDAWFQWETLCFNLAPRRCVFLHPGAEEHTGLQGIDRLALRDVDAIVTFHPGAPLPPGFAPVAILNPNALVARRR